MSVKFKSPKDPDEILDFHVRWVNRIDEDDEIVSSTFTLVDEDSTVGIDESFIDGTTTIMWLSGGVDGESCSILNRINTLNGRRMDQTLVVKIKTK